MGLLDLFRQVAGILQPAHGGTGSTYGEQRLVQRCFNSTGADLPLYTLVGLSFGANDTRVVAMATLDSTKVLGSVVGYFDGQQLVEADCPDGYEAMVQTAGIVRVLIESTVTRGQYAFAAATDGTMYSSATAAAGAFGLIVDSAATGAGHTYARVQMPLTASAGGGGGGTFGTPAIVLGTAAAAGSIDEAIRRDSTIVAFDATNPVTQAFGDAPDPGNVATAARRNHKHGMPANPTTGLAGAVELILVSPVTGVYVDIELPFAGTWTGWSVFNDGAGSIQYDVWDDTYANFAPTVTDTITASDKPKTTTAAKAQGACTGWTNPFVAGHIIRINVDSVSGVSRSVLVLKYTRS
jgi:hypothetical protein